MILAVVELPFGLQTYGHLPEQQARDGCTVGAASIPDVPHMPYSVATTSHSSIILVPI